MSNKEIAEELITSHEDSIKDSQLYAIDKPLHFDIDGIRNIREAAIKAAIVSCEFAIQGFSVVNKGLDEVYQDIRTPKGISSLTEPYKHSLEQIKAYLEGLL